jgi:sulfide:quinone oxidoreductase
MSAKVLVLGAGFAGLELWILSEAFGEAIEATLIDKGDTFIFGYAKLDVLFNRKTLDAVRLPYRSSPNQGSVSCAKPSSPSIQRSAA